MKQVELDHFARFCFPRRLRAGGGGMLSFETRRANVEENRYDNGLWLLFEDVAVPLLPEGEALKNHWWLSENTLLLAMAPPKAEQEDGMSAEETLLQTLPVTNGKPAGEPQPYARLRGEAEELAVLPDGRLLYTAAWDGNAPDEEDAGNPDMEDCEVLDEMPFWENGGSFTTRRRTRLHLWQQGKTTQLTGENAAVEGLWLDEEGRLAYFTLKEYSAVAPVADRLMVLDTQSLEMEELTFDALRLDGCVPLPQARLLVYGSDMKAHGLNQNPWFWLLEGDAGKQGLQRWRAFAKPGAARPRLLNSEGLYSGWEGVNTDLSQAAGARWQADAAGQGVYWLSAVGSDSQVLRLDTETGATTQVTTQPGSVTELALGPDSLYTIAMRGLAGPAVYRVDAGGGETAVTALNSTLQAEYAYVTPQEVRTAGSGGRGIRGWVLPPAGGFAPGGSPAILNIHGGPKTIYGTVLFHEMQYWAAQGYAVLFCNPTGSDGGGDAFGDLRGRYGGQDYDDIMAFLDAALAQCPGIDPQRLGVAGGSYGGFMTNWIIGHTTRFKAAASQRGIANWHTMALLSDIGYFFVPDQTNAVAPPHAWAGVQAPPTGWDMEGLWRQSPLAYADKVQTPTLFIHSQQDYRCPLPEGLQMYAALKLRGVPTRLCMFRDENHELSRSGAPRRRVRRLREMTQWFDTYLKGSQCRAGCE